MLPGTPVSQEARTPLQGKNELFRATSTRRKVSEGDFWGSLPASSRAHLVLTGLVALSIAVFCIQQFIVGHELLHILLAELAAAAFTLWFALEAVNHENAFELLAQAMVAFCLGGRLIYYLATTQHTKSQIAVCTTVLALLALGLCMAVASYSQFGWRLYSKIACDMRAKNAKSKQKTFLLVHVFLTVLKLDALLLLVLFLVAVSAGARRSLTGQLNIPLLIANPVGLVMCALLSAAIFLTVRNDWAGWERPVTAATPFSFFMPLFDIVIALLQNQPLAPSSKTSLILAAAIFIVSRSAMAILMQVLINRFRYLHLKRMLMQSETSPTGQKYVDEAPTGLAPLMKGAWIIKPSAGAPRKRRFFQLSSDGSTLRWAWDKYILLYFVEAQVNSDADLSIILKMATEPDLHLKFDSASQYCVWKHGLENVIEMLEQPTDVCKDNSSAAEQVFGEVNTVPHGMLRLLLLESRMPGKQTLGLCFKQAFRWLSCNKTLRRSVQDPKMKQYRLAKQRAFTLQSMGVRPEAACPGATATVQASYASPDAKQQRGTTIPSIQEFLEAISRGASPEREQAEYPMQRSFGKKRKELVIDCASPNTKQVSLNTQKGPPAGAKLTSKTMFSEAGMAQTKAISISRGDLTPNSKDRIGTIPLEHERTCLNAEPAAGITMAGLAVPVLSEHQSASMAERQASEMTAEAVDSQESLDTVGPLPSGGSRPQSAALLRSGSCSPPKVASADIGSVSGQANLDAAPLKDKVEVVVHEPTASDQRWDAFRRSNADTCTSAPTLHPLIQRSRTVSSSSLYGQTPLQSQGNSGNYTSEPHSYAGSLQSQSTVSSAASLYSNGPLKISVPFIPIHDIAIGRCLGEGSEGVVYAGSYLETPVAIKQLSYVQEMEMNLHIGSHDNVVALRGISRKDENLILVMEYCPKATLHLLLHGTAQSELDAFKLTSWVRAIARGMLHLHTRKPPILHRDLKPANIFVGHGFVMKIGDFGMSRHVALAKGPDSTPHLLRQLTSGVIGTTAYAAPELLDGQSYTEGQALTSATVDLILKSDVYSFGVTLWEMLTRKHPFSDMMSYQIQHAWMAEPQDMKLPPVQLPPNVSPLASQNLTELAALVNDCTEHDPARRPSFQEICLRLRHLPPRSSGILNSPLVASNSRSFSSQRQANA